MGSSSRYSLPARTLASAAAPDRRAAVIAEVGINPGQRPLSPAARGEDMDQKALAAIDTKLMERCIELSRVATGQGEFPFACVIARNGQVIAEATNRVARDRDITRHAELLAISEAQRAIGKTKLRNCSLYTNVEPCPMCSFPIREARISRVVFGIKSPVMGGFSRWNVLRDCELSNVMPEAFSEPPEVVAGFLAHEAERVWIEWNPLIWKIIKHRGCFAGPEESRGHWHKAPRQLSFVRSLLASLYR